MIERILNASPGIIMLGSTGIGVIVSFIAGSFLTNRTTKKSDGQIKNSRILTLKEHHTALSEGSALMSKDGFSFRSFDV